MKNKVEIEHSYFDAPDSHFPYFSPHLPPSLPDPRLLKNSFVFDKLRHVIFTKCCFSFFRGKDISSLNSAEITPSQLRRSFTSTQRVRCFTLGLIVWLFFKEIDLSQPLSTISQSPTAVLR